MILDEIMEELVTHYTGPKYRDEVIDGKKEFFDDVGMAGEESAQVELRMSQFLDWYMFSRELSSCHLTPMQHALEHMPIPFDENKKALLEGFNNAQHSLYEYIKTSKADVYVRDLFTNKKIVLKDSHVTTGFNADEIFEARLVPVDKTFLFSRGFCIHPAEARSFILKEIKKIKHLDVSSKESLMLRLMKMRYKFEQYQHIRLEYIYTNEGKLRL